MSRCFPFPPPGYEKKARTGHVELLLKGKHKKKKDKDKKEKRDKERGDDKERKHKGRSKEKHGEKKDQKEKDKDRDKKKDKDRNKKKDKDSSKDKGRISDEKVLELQSGICCEYAESGEKVGSYKDSKFEVELDRRINDERGVGSQKAENVGDKFQRKHNGASGMADGGRGRNNEMVPKFVHGQRIGGMVDMPRERIINDVANSRTGGMGDMPKERIINDVLKSVSVTEQRSFDAMGGLLGKDIHKKIDGKEKSNDQETNARKEDRHKDREREKSKKRKDKEREKEKKKEKDKTREKGERQKDREQITETEKKEQDKLSIRPVPTPKETEKSADCNGSLKRKEINGFLHEKDARPNKLQKTVPSSQLPVGNGRKLDSCDISASCISDWNGSTDNGKVEKSILNSEEHKINGLVESQRPSDSLNLRPPLAENGWLDRASTEPPHPDGKYLKQILCIPKMEEFSEADDQEWLFGTHALSKLKRETDADEVPLVWAKVVKIGKVDALALPYVIPY